LLYGADSPEERAVQAAWKVVGVELTEPLLKEA